MAWKHCHVVRMRTFIDTRICSSSFSYFTHTFTFMSMHTSMFTFVFVLMFMWWLCACMPVHTHLGAHEVKEADAVHHLWHRDGAAQQQRGREARRQAGAVGLRHHTARKHMFGSSSLRRLASRT